METKMNPEKVPGAGAYDVDRSDRAATLHKDFSSGFSSAFQKPIAVRRADSDVAHQPAPNSYDPSHAARLLFKSNNVCADSAFKSNSKRDIYANTAKNQPAPNRYNVNDEPLHPSFKVPYHSSFKSTSKRITFAPLENVPGYEKTTTTTTIAFKPLMQTHIL